MFFNRTFINLVIFGEHKTGKSSFLRRIMDNTFSDKYCKSYNDERKIKKISHNGRYYNVNIFIPLNENSFDYSSPIDFYLIFIDSNDISSFEYAKNLYLTKLTSRNNLINNLMSSVIFVSNKTDLQQSTFLNECKSFCNENSIDFFEISTKNNEGINEMNQKIVGVFDSDTFNEKIKFID